ncbi:hypothetical protein HMPREF9998_00133 [Peptostreptococcus anaerobius VPI 4330 = DSM 2949]|nr:hypothetical protein HMPREF9998_00133 [Peptostreptococcus anaerobius VPI 4330 = DSM 2949]
MFFYRPTCLYFKLLGSFIHNLQALLLILLKYIFYLYVLKDFLLSKRRKLN